MTLGAKPRATASRRVGWVLLEDGVHGLGTPGDHRLELVPVDLLGYRRAGVPDEISDGLDGYAVVAHQGHEGVTQLPRRPVLPEPRLHPRRLGVADRGPGV